MKSKAINKAVCETPEYKAWSGAKQRCHNPNHPKYPEYGGRGIEMCKRWRWSFAAFMHDMGQRDGACVSLDRIDNDKGYEPGNCRWASYATQGDNCRKIRLFTMEITNGTLRTWQEAADDRGVDINTWLRQLANEATNAPA